MPKQIYSVSGGTDEVWGKAVVSYTVNSTFGTDDSHEVTVILLNQATNNLFYEKHVLRKGEDSAEIFAMRRSLEDPEEVRLAAMRPAAAAAARAATAAAAAAGVAPAPAKKLVPAAKMGEALNRFGVVSVAPTGVESIKIAAAPASTMLRLDKIDLKLAVYNIAEVLIKKMYAGDFGDFAGADTSGNVDLTITFPSQCVEQRSLNGRADLGETMTVGGARKCKAQGDPVRVTFDVNHCVGT